MRIIVHTGFGVRDADLLQNVDGLGAKLLLVFHTVGAQAFLDLPADGIHRIEHRVRLLEYHGRLAAAHRAQLLSGQRQHVECAGILTVRQVYRAGGGGGFGQQLDDGTRGHGFAGTGFADHADHGLARNGEVHILDCLDRAGIRHEGDRQVLDIGEIALLGIVLRVLRLLCHGVHSSPLLPVSPSPVHSEARNASS